jgi:hypothetical protein
MFRGGELKLLYNRMEKNAVYRECRGFILSGPKQRPVICRTRLRRVTLAENPALWGCACFRIDEFELHFQAVCMKQLAKFASEPPESGTPTLADGSEPLCRTDVGTTL